MVCDKCSGEDLAGVSQGSRRTNHATGRSERLTRGKRRFRPPKERGETATTGGNLYGSEESARSH